MAPHFLSLIVCCIDEALFFLTIMFLFVRFNHTKTVSYADWVKIIKLILCFRDYSDQLLSGWWGSLRKQNKMRFFLCKRSKYHMNVLSPRWSSERSKVKATAPRFCVLKMTQECCQCIWCAHGVTWVTGGRRHVVVTAGKVREAICRLIKQAGEGRRGQGQSWRQEAGPGLLNSLSFNNSNMNRNNRISTRFN